MALLQTRKSVRNPLTRFHNEIDDLFHNFFDESDLSPWDGSRWPAIDVAEHDNEFVVKAEVPGCKAEDIDISVLGSRVVITGEKKQEEETEKKGYYHLERSYGEFRREFNLRCDVDPNKVSAVCKDGMLTITLPKTEKAKLTKVKVKSQ
jgi:HSP20 family protein